MPNRYNIRTVEQKPAGDSLLWGYGRVSKVLCGAFVLLSTCFVAPAAGASKRQQAALHAFAQGSALFEQKSYKEALAKFTKARDKAPQGSQWQGFRGSLLYYMGMCNFHLGGWVYFKRARRLWEDYLKSPRQHQVPEQRKKILQKLPELLRNLAQLALQRAGKAYMRKVYTQTLRWVGEVEALGKQVKLPTALMTEVLYLRLAVAFKRADTVASLDAAERDLQRFLKQNQDAVKDKAVKSWLKSLPLRRAALLLRLGARDTEKGKHKSGLVAFAKAGEQLRRRKEPRAQKLRLQLLFWRGKTYIKRRHKGDRNKAWKLLCTYLKQARSGSYRAEARKLLPKACSKPPARFTKRLQPRSLPPKPQMPVAPWTWALLGVGAAVLVGGGVFGILSRTNLDTSEKLAQGEKNDKDNTIELGRTYRMGREQATVANVLFLGGGVLAVGGVGSLLFDLLLRGPQKTRPPKRKAPNKKGFVPLTF